MNTAAASVISVSAALPPILNRIRKTSAFFRKFLMSTFVGRLTPHPIPLTIMLLLIFSTGCSNIIRSGLMNSNTVFLDPSTQRTAYLQLRNISENQAVTLSDIQTKLTTKGYQLTADPQQANYWIQAKVVYCHKAADEVTPESVAKAGFGAGISSGGAAMASASNTGMEGMAMERDADGRRHA